MTDLRHARNHEFHRGNKFLSDIEFNDLWKKTTKMLEKHGFNIQLVGDLQKMRFIFRPTVQGYRNKNLFSRYGRKLFL